jgi:hypothetical protein
MATISIDTPDGPLYANFIDAVVVRGGAPSRAGIAGLW